MTDKNMAAEENVPPHFICPITYQVMKDPVIDNDGVSYEREAITEWLRKGNTTSPTTQKPLLLSDLRPNRALREAIEQHLGITTTVPAPPLLSAEETSGGSAAVMPAEIISAGEFCIFFLTTHHCGLCSKYHKTHLSSTIKLSWLLFHGYFLSKFKVMLLLDFLCNSMAKLYWTRRKRDRFRRWWDNSDQITNSDCRVTNNA